MKKEISLLILKNFSSLIVAQVIYKIFTFIGMIVIARFLGVDGFGQISFALSFVWSFLFLNDFGFTDLFIRDVAKKSELLGKYVNNIVTLKIGIAFLNLIVIFLIASLFFRETVKFWLTIILGTAVIMDSFVYFFRCIFRVKEKMEYEGLLILIEAATKLGLILLITKLSVNSPHTILIALALLMASFLNFLLNLTTFSLTFKIFFFSLDRKFYPYLLRTAFPFALVYIFSLISFRVDIIMLFLLKGDIFAGLFNANCKIIEQFILIPISLSAVYLPIFSRRLHSGEEFHRILLTTVFVLPVASLLIIFACYLFSDKLILTIYGNKFQEASKYLLVFSLVLLPFSIKPIIEKALYALGKQNLVCKIYLLSVLSNITLNIIFIPLFGVNGAALSTFLCESAVVIACFTLYWKNRRMVRLGYEPTAFIDIDEI